MKPLRVNISSKIIIKFILKSYSEALHGMCLAQYLQCGMCPLLGEYAYLLKDPSKNEEDKIMISNIQYLMVYSLSLGFQCQLKTFRIIHIGTIRGKCVASKQLVGKLTQNRTNVSGIKIPCYRTLLINVHRPANICKTFAMINIRVEQF